MTMTTLVETERTAQRVLGGRHPLVRTLGSNLRVSRTLLRARETDKAGARTTWQEAVSEEVKKAAKALTDLYEEDSSSSGSDDLQDARAVLGAREAQLAAEKAAQDAFRTARMRIAQERSELAQTLADAGRTLEDDVAAPPPS